MVRRQQTTACEQAGQWISLRLDGELSELEGAGLDRHLERCAVCSTLAAELTGIAQLLRTAPLVEFELEPARVVPRRRRASVASRRAAFAAVASAAAAAAAFVLLGSSGSAQPSGSALKFRSTSEEVRFLRVQQLRGEPPVASVVVTPPRINPRRLL
jgi:anti-sigma factor RsiW